MVGRVGGKVNWHIMWSWDSSLTCLVCRPSTAHTHTCWAIFVRDFYLPLERGGVYGALVWAGRLRHVARLRIASCLQFSSLAAQSPTEWRPDSFNFKQKNRHCAPEETPERPASLKRIKPRLERPATNRSSRQRGRGELAVKRLENCFFFLLTLCSLVLPVPHWSISLCALWHTR